MAKIADVINLKSGYANFVELKSAYEEIQENADRMAMYRPTKAHRVAFERVSRGLINPNDKKFYMISGSYGTGKSHLCLMLANFCLLAKNTFSIVLNIIIIRFFCVLVYCFMPIIYILLI